MKVKKKLSLKLPKDIDMISQELQKQLRKQKNPETLRKWLKPAAHSGSIEAFKWLISESAGAEKEKTDKLASD